MSRHNILLSLALFLPSNTLAAPSLPKPASIDAEVNRAMAESGAKGLALAVIDHGKVVFVRAYGVRNSDGEPLQTNTVMYGASLTKAVFSYAVMTLVDEGKLKLDTPIANYLAKPLTEYPTESKYSSWSDLAGDDRWRLITPRHIMTHSTGFANFGFLEPDHKLKIHSMPGTHYAYSGDGILLLQFTLEKGLGVDVGNLTEMRVFKPLGMTRTSLMWRDDFAGNLADGWAEDGHVEEHDQRSKIRAAGSMDTTIDDFSKFAAAFVRGDGLTKTSRAEMVEAQIHITTSQQFPTLLPDAPIDKQRRDLAAGLGVIVFDGAQGHGFYKGGHDDTTANTWVCVKKRQRCVVILSNDVRSEKMFPEIVKFILGDTGVPYEWEYGLQKR